MESRKNFSLTRLFLSCLKIGTIGFGGFVAAIAVAERELVGKAKLVRSEDVADAIAVTSIMPGSFAINTIAAIGFRMAGVLGALIACLGMLLPSCLLMIGLAAGYQQVQSSSIMQYVLQGLIPAVIAIIAAVIWSSGRKNLADRTDVVVMLGALLIFASLSGFLAILVCMGGAALVGTIVAWYRNWPGRSSDTAKDPPSENRREVTYNHRRLFLICLLVLVLAYGVSALLSTHYSEPAILQLFLRFAVLSVSFFGGGYVAIPLLHEIIVTQQNWASDQVFAHALALGQSTPGPILVTATFVGYLVAGLSGAFTASLGIFLPPLLLSVIAVAFAEVVRSSRWGEAALRGLRPAVTGLLLYALYTLGVTLTPNWISATLTLCSLVCLFRWSVSIPLLLIGSGIASAVLNHLVLQ